MTAPQRPASNSDARKRASARIAENDARPTHIVYRIGTDFSWHETPCWCPAGDDHPVDQTRVIPPGSSAS